MNLLPLLFYTIKIIWEEFFLYIIELDIFIKIKCFNEAKSLKKHY